MKNLLRVALLFCALYNFVSLNAQPGCPAVNAGADVNIPCSQSCATLTASAFSAAQTTTYSVASIPYAPPFPFNSGNAILVNTDDVWSSVINLPFHFCFFGTSNNQIIVGSNGVVGFNTANAGLNNSWQITGALPANAPADIRNCIMGPWQDIDPTFQGQIFYQVTGAAPCRTFEVSWYRVPYYGDPNSVSTGSCPSALFATQQIVLYETTNAIEIYINNKALCTGWNGGLAVEGIINAAATTAITVPGRNATQWTAVNDAYRFTPAGAPNYSIAWFDGATQIGTGNSISVCPPSSRSYTAKATYTDCDNSTVVVTDDVFVGISSLTVRTDSIHPIKCFGGSGDIYASFTSTGSAVLSYGWTPGGVPNSTSITGVPAGTYVFSVTDATNCTKYDTVTLTQPPLLTVNVPDTTITSCAGGNIGALTAHASGGTGAYTYAWNTGPSGQTLSNIGAGTYTVTVTDANGCTATATGHVVINVTTITFNPPQITDAICTSSTGSISVSSSGGTGAITYSWSNSLPNGSTVTGLASGTYSVTATDANGCTASASYTVNQTNPTSFGTPTIVDATCGNSNGSITVTVNGTTGTVSYTWSNALPDSNTQTGLAAGTYSVTSTDGNGCTASASYTVNSVGGITLGAPVVTDIHCGIDGSIVVAVIGGTQPVDYAWSGGLPNNDTVTISAAGTYTVTATDANGCTATGSYTVNQTVGITFGAPVITDITCGTSGNIVVTLINATEPVDYNWSGGLANNDTVSVSVGGTYAVTATDANGCTATASYTVNQNSSLVIDSAVVLPVTCNGSGSITIYASGGSGALTYTWSGGQTGNVLTVTTPGTYAVTVVDASGCSVTGSYSVSNVPCSGCPAIATTNSLTIPCGQTCTTLQASAYAGAQTTSYTVSQIAYNPVSAYNVGTPILVNVDDRWSGIINIPFGFCFFGTSHNQLVVGSNGAVSFNLANANTGSGYVIGGPIPSANPTNLHDAIMGPWQDMDPTNQGLIYYNIIGTYPCRKFVVSWYHVPMYGDPNSVSTNSCPSPIFQTQQIVLYETTNAIQVYIENKDVCPNWNSGRAIEGIQDPTGTIAYTVPGRNATQWTAQNDAWTFLPAGAQNYVVSWFLGGNQIGTGNSIQVCPTVNTTYGVQAVYTNCNGAQVTLTDTINVSTSGNPITSQIDSVHPVTCFNGTDGAVYASFDTTGLVIDSFGWSPGGMVNQTSLTGIPAGTYVFTVVTTDGCFSTDTVILANPAPFTVNVPDTVISTCQLGSFATLTATTTGGIPGYVFDWSTQEHTQTITNLGVGTYSVTVTDTLGCTATDAGTVTSTGGLAINNAIVTDATCGNINGSIIVSVSGGTNPITYTWTNGSNNDTLTGLAGGTYCVTATDAGGCSATACYTINQTNGVSIDTAYVTDASCGANNGSITLIVSTSASPVTFTWPNGLPNSGTITGLAGGTYCVTVTDANGCSATACYTVIQTPGVAFGNPVITNIACGSTSGSIVVTVTGGAAPIDFIWSSGLPNNDTVTNLSAGTYTVTATDANGCSATASYSINQSTGLTISANVSDESCTGPGSINLTVTGGSGNYTYTWTGGLTGNPATAPAAGSYSVTVTDQSGCSATGYYIVGNTPCGDCPAVATNNNVNLACGETCAELHASAVNGAQTTAYTVAQIPYSPPQPFNVGTPILVNIDDTYSSVINLPFNFCFFGTTNNQVVVGSNGVVTFNTANAGQTNSWQIPGPIPSGNPADLTNCIMGPWHDMDPTNQGAIYYSIGGTYPCRSFTVSWYQVPMYGDPNSVSTSQCPDPLFEVQQIVLYETTNAIDVFIQQKDVCTGWNGGLAIEGIQDATGTLAYTVPGRNATQWTAQNDAWRFSPAGAPNYVINWFQNGNLIGSGDSIQVCPASTTTYGVQAIYTNCDNSTISVSDSVIVNVSGTLTGQVDSVHNITCFGGNSGAVYASYNNTGGGNVSYGWSPGIGGVTSMTGLSAGTYVFTVTNGTGCIISDTAVVTEPTQLIVTVPDTTAYNCTPSSGITAVLTATVSGGTPGYTYQWTGGSTNTSITVNIPGTYNVIVTDSVGCTATDASTVSLIIASPIFNTPVITNASCSGTCDGSIQVSLSQSTPTIVYAWSNGSASDTLSGLCAGAYHVTAVDANTCSVTATYNITSPPAIVIDTPAVITQATCSVGGTITITVGGGTGTLTIHWSNGDTGNTADSLAAGTYTVTVTDANNCSTTASYTVTTAAGSVQLGQPVITNVTCNGGNDGSIVANASGGTGTLIFTWNNQGTGDSIGGLTAGTYSVTVVDQNGCSASASYDVTQPAPITVDSVLITQATCQTGGTITIVTVSGGTGPYTFAWSNGDGGNFIDSLAGGPYTVTVTDVNGCTATFTYTVPTDPSVIAFGTPAVTNITCNGANDGSITITITGGTAPDSIHWNNGASTATISGLSAGAYSVTITDAVGCSASTTYNITEPVAVTLGTPTITQATCQAGGSVCVTATGGTGTLTYTWSNGGSGTCLNGVGAGPYDLTVTDANGCSVTANFTVPAAPGTVQFDSATVVDATCAGNDGSITVFASGGSGAISYNWGGGITGPTRTGLAPGSYSVTISDQNNCTASTTYIINGATPITIDSVFATQASCQGGGTLTVVTIGGGAAPYTIGWSNGDNGYTADSLSAGSYTVTVTDNAGCSASGTYSVTGAAGVVQITQPVISNVSCNGGNNGSIGVTVIGGSGVIHYQWSTSAADTFASVTGLGVGTYTVTAQDNFGCSASATYNITEPATIAVTVTASQLMCFGDSIGSAYVTASGGTIPYSYHWNTGATTDTITNQPVGIVVVTVTDETSCSVTASGFIDQESDYYTSTIVTQPNCSNIGFGNVSIGPKIIGVGIGHGPYTLTVNGVGTINIPAIDSVGVFPNLASGTYSFVITDSLGCSRQGTFDVNAGVANDSATATTDSTTCTLNNGRIIVTPVSVANAPYAYSFDGGATYTSDSIGTGFAAGTYTVYLRNTFGCPDSITTTVLQYNTIDSFDVNVDSTTCFGDQFNDGSITLTPLTSNGPYQYSITGDSYSADSAFTGLSIGNYSVYVTNASGCADTLAATVYQPLQVGIQAVPDTVLTAPGVGNTLTVNTSNYVNPIYEWSPVEGLSSTDSAVTTATVTQYTVYYVTVSEASNKHCAAFDSIVVIVTGNFRMPNAFTPNGDGRNDLYSPISFGLANITEFRIYNRWGQLVHNENAPWDGKLHGDAQPAGTYIYYITVETPDENNPGGFKTEKQQGSFSLLR